jgi:cell pole-organizing protein PopZ
LGDYPSMEDILASIRRILSEDEQTTPADQAAAASQPTEGAPSAPPAHGVTAGRARNDDASDVLDLDASMMVPDEPPAPLFPSAVSPLSPPMSPPRSEPVVLAAEGSAEHGVPETDLDMLVAPHAAAAAASSVSSLVRTLAAGRSTQVYRNGPTIEDLVREEIRPLLKQWLDTHLPTLVERLVRIEIERVVGRAMH